MTAERIGPCGPTGLRLHHYDWVPEDAQVVAALDLQAHQLQSSLDRLAAWARGSGHGLPIDVAFGLGQWNWQVPLVERALRASGFEPAELAYVRTRIGLGAWVWTIACDVEDAKARMERAWGVSVRRTVTGAIGTPIEGSPFAFDVVFLAGERVALTARGRGSELLHPFDDRSLSTDESARPGRRLERVEGAPIRLVIASQGLLDPESPLDGPPLRGLQIDDEGIRASDP